MLAIVAIYFREQLGNSQWVLHFSETGIGFGSNGFYAYNAVIQSRYSLFLQIITRKDSLYVCILYYM